MRHVLPLVFLVGIVGFVSACVAGSQEVRCPPDYREVEECPKNEECRRIEGDSRTLICERLTCDTDPECPVDSDRVEECYTGDRCFLQQRCGDAIMCREQNPFECEHEPECPRQSERVNGCPPDALCFEVRRCGSSITCEDLTAD